MRRVLTLAAAQLGPIQKAEGREAAVFPGLALTTSFPRWYDEEEEVAAADRWFEAALPSPATAQLFDAAD